MTEIKAKEGYYLVSKDNKTICKAIIGMSVKPEDYKEITEEEAKKLMENNNTNTNTK